MSRRCKDAKEDKSSRCLTLGDWLRTRYLSPVIVKIALNRLTKELSSSVNSFDGDRRSSELVPLLHVLFLFTSLRLRDLALKFFGEMISTTTTPASTIV